MPDLMLEQKKYLEARLKDCQTTPELNKNQIKEYQLYLEMLAGSKDANEYADKIAFSGDMFSISQAEQLDRYENFIKIRKLFGDEISQKGDQFNLEAARSSKTHMDLYEKMTAATPKAAEYINLSREIIRNIATFITGLVVYKTCADSRKSGKKSDIAAIWNQLKNLDPEISWEKLMTYPPYRSLLMFDDERLGVMKSWFMEVLS